MITITDFPNETQPYWEVVDSTGKQEKYIINYDPNDPVGYNRVYVLKQIVEICSIMSGCQNKAWQTVGSVFILS
jgi:hypothetical protein